MSNDNPFYHRRLEAEYIARLMVEKNARKVRELADRMRHHRMEAERLERQLAVRAANV